MTTNSRIDTVIFDFDVTIMYTNGVIMRSWQHTYRTLTGHDGDVDHILSTFGEPLEFSLENAFPEVPVKESLKIYRDWHREHFPTIPHFTQKRSTATFESICRFLAISLSSMISMSGISSKISIKTFVIITTDRGERQYTPN